METLFPLGHLVIAQNAQDVLDPQDVKTCLDRHASGDWGEVCELDWQENEVNLPQGSRLFSVYHDRNGIKFHIVSEADRLATTVLLPSDY